MVEFLPSSPQVMLSPNASNEVTISVGGGAGASTVTPNVHGWVARCSASLAVHDTVCTPTSNSDPDVGLQVTVTGALPLVVVGLKVTAIDVPAVS